MNHKFSISKLLTFTSRNHVSAYHIPDLGMDKAAIRPSKTVVRAFDGSRRAIIWEVALPVEMGPYTFEITFKVLDIPVVYNF